MNITESTTANILSDFDDIKQQYRIDDERFEKGLRFALLISEGKSRGQAMMDAYDMEDKRKASSEGAKFSKLKWVSALIDRLITGNHILFAADHYNALKELYQIGINGESERNRVDALKAFIDSTKRPEAKVDTQINFNIGANLIQELEEQLAQLVNNNMMIDTSGQVVKVIEHE